MKEKKVSNIMIEGARLLFRNFAGKKTTVNPAGKRNFCVYVDIDSAERLKEDGWNIRFRELKMLLW